MRAWGCLVFTFLLLVTAGLAVVLAPNLAETEVEQIKQLADDSAEIILRRDLHDVAIVSDTGEVVAVGENGMVLSSRDNGKTWRFPDPETRSDIHALDFDAKRGTVVASGEDGMVLVSDDDGEHWRPRRTTTSKTFYDIAMAENPSNVIAVGRRDTIFHSSDGGRRWDQAVSFEGFGTLNAVTFLGNDQAAVAVGDNGRVLLTGDAGKNWQQLASGTTADFEAVARYGDNGFIAVGEDESIILSKGADGELEKVGTENPRGYLYSIAVDANTKTAVAVGKDGVILLSGNEITAPWTRFGESLLGRKDDLHAVAIHGAESNFGAIAVGEDGTIFVSEDGGKNWSYSDGRTREDLQAVAFDDSTAVIVGTNATILLADLSEGNSLKTADIEIALSGLLQALAGHVAQSTVEDGSDSEKEMDSGTDDTDANNSWIFVVQVNSLRAGILLVLIFAGQHLLALARYNFRLAAFYRARADAATMVLDGSAVGPDRLSDFERMAATLSPDMLDFGRTPQSAIEQLMRREQHLLEMPGRRDRANRD